MVIHPISHLIKLAKDFEDGELRNGVLDKNNPVFIFGSNVKKLIYTSYDHD